MARPLTQSRIVLASHNAGKISELRLLLSPFSILVDSAADHNLGDVEETGATFEGNAQLKAEAAAQATGLPALADDSGLVVDALDGAPGIYSARWAGDERDFARAMRTIEEKLQSVGADLFSQRQARFVSVLCLFWPDGHAEFFRGEVEGELVWPPRGNQGFGYDPIFQPNGYEKTFGEMSTEEKHGWAKSGPGLSHRARAVAQFITACLPNDVSGPSFHA